MLHHPLPVAFGNFKGTVIMSHIELVGLELSVTTAKSQEFIGRMYAFDLGLNLLILVAEHDSKRDYHFINADSIENIVITDKTPRVLDQTLPTLDVNKMLQRADYEIRHETDQMAKMNLSASLEAQQIFRELSKTYQCDWDGESIVLSAVGATLRPPYTHIESRDAQHHLNKLVIGKQLHSIRSKLMIS